MKYSTVNDALEELERLRIAGDLEVDSIYQVIRDMDLHSGPDKTTVLYSGFSEASGSSLHTANYGTAFASTSAQ